MHPQLPPTATSGRVRDRSHLGLLASPRATVATLYLGRLHAVLGHTYRHDVLGESGSCGSQIDARINIDRVVWTHRLGGCILRLPTEKKKVATGLQ